ncbi:MAG: SMC-Scp complex subunit ScpB [bacterium]
MKSKYQITQHAHPDVSGLDNQVSESQIIEAVLFSSQQSLTIQQISKITGIKKSKTIRRLLEELNRFYQEHKRAFFIQQVAGGYQLRTESHFQKWIQRGRLVKPIRLSQSVMETLSIIAYQQPVTRAEIEDIRTVDATYAIRTLLNKKLIRILGRKEIMGRPILYGSSKLFLEVFGFNSISDLPRPEDFDIMAVPDQSE